MNVKKMKRMAREENDLKQEWADWRERRTRFDYASPDEMNAMLRETEDEMLTADAKEYEKLEERAEALRETIEEYDPDNYYGVYDTPRPAKSKYNTNPDFLDYSSKEISPERYYGEVDISKTRKAYLKAGGDDSNTWENWLYAIHYTSDPKERKELLNAVAEASNIPGDYIQEGGFCESLDYLLHKAPPSKEAADRIRVLRIYQDATDPRGLYGY